MSLTRNDLLARLQDRSCPLDESDLAAARQLLAEHPAAAAELVASWRLDDHVSRILVPERASLAGRVRATITMGHSGKFIADVRRAAARRTRPLRWPVWVCACAAGLALAWTGALWLTDEPWAVQESAHVAGVRPLRGGETIQEAGPSVIRFQDGSRLHVAEASVVRIHDDQGAKRIEVAQGRLDAEIMPQPAGLPMRLETAHAMVTVVGTVFRIDATPDRTEVSVSEGQVEVQHRSSGRIEKVSAGGDITVGQDALVLSCDFEDGPMWPGSTGTVVPAPGRSGEHCAQAEEITKDAARRVRLDRQGDQGLFVHRDGSHLHFDYRLEIPSRLTVYVWDRTSQLSIGGYHIEAKVMGGDGWHRAAVPLAALGMDGKRLTPGDVITQLSFQSHISSGGLWIDRVRITAGPDPPSGF